LPVKVWLYGGDNTAGGISNPLYDGCFASSGAIQVSINYRVGPLGFLAVQSLGLTGNYGIQDQLQGLRWVQENIAAFGGDPAKVLLFGQSAGADDTLVISTLPGTGSLFHAAIMQSGDYHIFPTLDEASKENTNFVAALNCSTGGLACLRATSLDAMNTTALKMDLPTLIVDGKVISSQPMDVGPRVPSIIGTLASEGSLSLLAEFQFAALSLNQSSYDTFLTTTFGTNAGLINQTYPISLFAGASVPAFAAMSAVITYSSFRCPARRVLAKAVANGTPVWTYSFNHTLSCSWLPQVPNIEVALQILGAAHTAEIPFVFGEVTGLPRPDGTCDFNATERAISASFVDAWNEMAAAASPGGGWPAYTGSDSKGVNIAQDGWHIGTVDYSMCDFWDKLEASSTGGNATSTTTPSTPTSSTKNAAPRAGSFGSLGLSSLVACLIASLIL
jgi:carboxylesterase type B